jgi:hypothetical protein
MADGLPYRSPKAWIEHPMYGFGNWPTPENFGAHDIAPHTSRPNPFSHWVNIIGKSAEGLMLADNLSNLDELLEMRSCTIVSNRQDACSTKTLLSCGTGILPVPKRLIENGARSQLKLLEKKYDCKNNY